MFFFTSSVLSVVGKTKRTLTADVFEKGATRDATQVTANGGFAAALILCNLLRPSDLWYLAYTGSLAAAAADTWGTELGISKGGPPRLVTTWRRVPAGRSGGITAMGTLGGLVGAILVGASTFPWLPDPLPRSISSIVLSGIAGSMTDSFIGATLQTQYQCPKCRINTERRERCDGPSMVTGGVHWLNNNAVNALCTLTGSAVAPAAFSIFR